MNKVLIVVDCQNDFIFGALGTPEARGIVDNVLQKVIEARKNNDTIIFTKDLHYEEDYCDSVESAFVPRHCMANEDGHWIIECLRPYMDYWVTKSTYGYTHWEDLPTFIANADFIEVIGVCTDICVISNVLMLRSLYPTIPIVVDESCCAGTTPAAHRAALTVMESCNIEVIKRNLIDF